MATARAPAADWTGATPPLSADTGTTAFTQDGTVTTGAAPTAGALPNGCYSWTETITGPNFLGQTVIGPGQPNEYFQATPYQPTIATTANPASSVGVGVNTVTDTVTISNSDLGGAYSAPASAALSWILLGPVPPPAPGLPGA